MSSSPDSLASVLSQFPVNPRFRFTEEELGVTSEDFAAVDAMDQGEFIRAEAVATRKLLHDGELTGIDRALAMSKVALMAAALGMELIVVEAPNG
jgi:hypothetical protein